MEKLKIYHFVSKQGEERVSCTAGCVALCLPLGLPVLPEQTTSFGAPIAQEHKKQEKFLGFPFICLQVYSEGLFLNRIIES